VKSAIVLFSTLFFLIFVHKTAYAADVYINEFLPNPTGQDTHEWIELYNSGAEDVSLDGWYIEDVFGSTKQFSLNGYTIATQTYIILDSAITGISLNNDKEQVKLTSPDSIESFSDMYQNSQENISYALFSGLWQKGLPTPGTVNSPLPSPTPIMSPSPTPTPVPTIAPSPPPELTSIPNLQLSEISACSTPEWVEVYNENRTQLDFMNISIRDAIGGNRTFSGYSDISSFFVLEWSNGMLNNTGDSVYLYWKENLLDIFHFPSCSSGKTFSKNPDGSWIETVQISKNAENAQISAQEPSSPSAALEVNVNNVLLEKPTSSSPFPAITSMSFSNIPSYNLEYYEDKEAKVQTPIQRFSKTVSGQDNTLFYFSFFSMLSSSLVFLLGSTGDFFTWYNAKT